MTHIQLTNSMKNVKLSNSFFAIDRRQLLQFFLELLLSALDLCGRLTSRNTMDRKPENGHLFFLKKKFFLIHSNVTV